MKRREIAAQKELNGESQTEATTPIKPKKKVTN